VVSLAEARELAVDCQRKLRAGIDPIDEKKAARLVVKLERAKAMTFKQCAEAYIAAHERGWKNPKHAAQWPSTMEAYVYPVFGALPVAAADTGLVMKAIEPLWTTRTETASRVRGRIESVLDWATTAGYRTGENPAWWKGHLENLLPKKSKVAPVKNLAALPYLELPAFMAELGREDGIGALALQFTILTAARTGEVINARWDEINFAEKLWTIPAERMKAGREHRVPLSAPVIEILATMQRLPPSPFVFPANRRRPVSNMIMLMTLRRMGRADLTVHGFRSCFSDWCAERTAFPSEVREMALAHQVGDKVEAAYRRGDLFEKRRQVMDAWARFATSPAPEGLVVPLAAAHAAAGGAA
jgi:integrase